MNFDHVSDDVSSPLDSLLFPPPPPLERAVPAGMNGAPLSRVEVIIANHYCLFNNMAGGGVSISAYETAYVRQAISYLQRQLYTPVGIFVYYHTNSALQHRLANVACMTDACINALHIEDKRTAFRLLHNRVMALDQPQHQARRDRIRREGGPAHEGPLIYDPFHKVATDRQVVIAMKLSEAFRATPGGGIDMGEDVAEAEAEEIRGELMETLRAIVDFRGRLLADRTQDQERLGRAERRGEVRAGGSLTGATAEQGMESRVNRGLRTRQVFGDGRIDHVMGFRPLPRPQRRGAPAQSEAPMLMNAEEMTARRRMYLPRVRGDGVRRGGSRSRLGLDGAGDDTMERLL